MDLSLNFPVVLINGLIFPYAMGPVLYFHRVKESYPHIKFISVPLPPFGTQAERMRILKKELDDLSFKEFHLVGHSQGGIDGRWLLEDSDFRKRVLTLTSINSPFKGTTVLDVIPIMKKQWGHLIELYNNPLKPQDHVPHFCANTVIYSPDDFKHYPIFRWLYPRILNSVGKNDGFVGLHSMRMGEEIVLEDGDHLSNIGWPGRLGFHLLGSINTIDFFSKIFYNLAQWEKLR